MKSPHRSARDSAPTTRSVRSASGASTTTRTTAPSSCSGTARALQPRARCMRTPTPGFCLSAAARSSRARPFTTASRSTSSGTASHRDPDRSLEKLAILMAMSVSEQMPLADVKNRLSEVVDRLEREHGRVVITKHGHPAAVVISVEDLESLEETLDVMGSAALLEDIREALAELSTADAPVLAKDDALRLIADRPPP